MLMQHSKKQCRQRVQIKAAPGGSDQQVKICLENYDETLGWYSAGAITLDQEHLADLEAAINQLRRERFLDGGPANRISFFCGDNAAENN